MKSLQALVDYMQSYLAVETIADYPQALNGLQLQNSGSVRRIAAAVDASEAVIREAVAAGADLLLVHHGMFWNPGVLTGARYRKVRVAMEGDLAIYSAHLPLDFHPVVGNNAILAKLLGLRKMKPFLFRKGQAMGLRGEISCSLHELALRLETALAGAAHLCPGGSSRPRHVGIVTGGAGSEVEAVSAEGVDTFVTGEGPHWSYPLAEELGLNVFYGGHYATETFGVKALAQHLSKRFRLPWEFIDHPTGL
jgi:dinuclear metal center YbgI/SA1388 family protein